MKYFSLLLLSSLLLGACAKNPVTGEHDLARINIDED
jgi:hypothetical protein